ncbi:MAG: DDE-type integrase/transposase/recombinase, partial [Bacteroidetes bacterium]|nr:DDE-type integrase/transposase/recombinase [Bacteroidota bacterium]
MLTYSNREWGTPCPSESMLTIRHGFQSSIFRLGHTPATLSTDSSTAATHKPVAQLREDDIQAVRRVFNSKYLDMLSHFGVKPRVITLGEPHENGDVESLNGAFKRRVERLHGRNRAQINYRHLIGSLSRKPGALRNYRYREEMFLTLRFRMAYDLLCETCSERTADVEYVRILALAANTVESAVDETLG